MEVEGVKKQKGTFFNRVIWTIICWLLLAQRWMLLPALAFLILSRAGPNISCPLKAMQTKLFFFYYTRVPQFSTLVKVFYAHERTWDVWEEWNRRLLAAITAKKVRSRNVFHALYKREGSHLEVVRYFLKGLYPVRYSLASNHLSVGCICYKKGMHPIRVEPCWIHSGIDNFCTIFSLNRYKSLSGGFHFP